MAQIRKLEEKPSQRNIRIPGIDHSNEMRSPQKKQLSNGCELIFKNVTVTIAKKEILKDINGLAKPGEMLAIMGPSGAGKTTLLNCLAGRRNVDSGEITMNSLPLSKSLRRKISYVLQQDIFLTKLTCWQTIWYTAMLRLPGSMPTAEKEKRVYEIIDALDMRKCLHTRIGDHFIRGLSGGEKKRTTIACELLTNPALMLLDEPTSGLDSSTAFSLCSTIKRFAQSSGKTVIMTIHQPSSQIFNMFDKLLLLCEGQVAYYGDVKKCADYFRDMELPCPANYNLADHILDLVKDSAELQTKIIEEAAARMKNGDWYPNKLKELPSCDQIEQTDHSKLPSPDTNGHQLENGHSKGKVTLNSIDYKDGVENVPIANGKTSHVNKAFTHDKDVESGIVKFSDVMTEQYEEEEEDDDAIKYMKEYNSRWPTSFFLQYKVLAQRLFHQTWPRILSKWNILQTGCLGIVAGIIWFQIEATEEKLIDRQGMIFFTTTFIGFFSLIDATLSFAEERGVVNKERLAGYYRLSAYYLAKVSCELPLVLLLVTMFFTIIYWMSGINLNFLVYLQIMGIYYLVAAITQGVGSCFGALLLEIPFAMMCSNLVMLTTMMAGGFYITHIPFWAIWLKYVSYMSYIFQSVLYIEYTNTDIRCSEGTSVFALCLNETSTLGTNQNISATDRASLLPFIPKNDLLAKYTWHSQGWTLSYYLLVIFGLIFILRLSTYIVLRFIRKPHVA